MGYQVGGGYNYSELDRDVGFEFPAPETPPPTRALQALGNGSFESISGRRCQPARPPGIDMLGMYVYMDPPGRA